MELTYTLYSVESTSFAYKDLKFRQQRSSLKDRDYGAVKNSNEEMCQM